LYLEPDGATSQEQVAKGGEGGACQADVAAHTEEVRVLALHQQAAGIVGEIAEPCVELAAAQEELVAVVGGEKQAMVAVVGFGLLRCCLLRCCLLR
jgi:hypothetical protein